MDLRRRLIGRSIIRDGLQATGFDLDGLLRRLVLFDTYILKSFRLKEFPYLIHALGFDGVMELLHSGALDLQCEGLGIGGPVEQKGDPPWPSNYVGFSVMDMAFRDRFIHDCLQPLHDCGLPHEKVLRLERAIVNKLVRPSPDMGNEVIRQSTLDVLGNSVVMKSAVQTALLKDVNVSDSRFRISFEQASPMGFVFDADISQRYGLDQRRTASLVQSGLFAVATMNQRILEMRDHQALSGFCDNEVSIFSDKLLFLARTLDPDLQEKSFQRVLRISGFPEFRLSDGERKIDIPRLLEIRESQECAEFRLWLSTAGSATDVEIKERLDSVRAKLGTLAQSTGGKLLRFITTCGLGGVGPVIGVIAGGIDTFLLDKILPKSGTVSFLSNLYPSIFKEP